MGSYHAVDPLDVQHGRQARANLWDDCVVAPYRSCMRTGTITMCAETGLTDAMYSAHTVAFEVLVDLLSMDLQVKCVAFKTTGNKGTWWLNNYKSGHPTIWKLI